MRAVRGFGLPADIACPLPVCGHGLDMNADIRLGHGADIKSFAGEGVGLALGLNMMGNVLLLLLKNFFPPAFQLRGDGLNASDLLNGS